MSRSEEKRQTAEPRVKTMGLPLTEGEGARASVAVALLGLRDGHQTELVTTVLEGCLNV